MQTLAVKMDNELSAARFLLFWVEGKEGELDFMPNGWLWAVGAIQSFASSLQTLGVKVRYISNFFLPLGRWPNSPAADPTF